MIFPSNQSKRTSDNERTNQISRYKSQNLWTSSASKRKPSKWKQYQLWILLNLREKFLKFGENRRNVQKIFDSVRKELQDECHCAWSLLKITWTCPIWQPEKMVEKLNRSSCFVKFCWFGIVWNHSTSSGSRLLRLLLVPTEEFSDRLVDSGQMRNVWSCCERNFHSCGLTARVLFLTNQHPTTVL